MVKVTARLCYLCYDIGVNKFAVATYTAGDGEDYDICEECKKSVGKAGLESFSVGEYIKERA